MLVIGALLISGPAPRRPGPPPRRHARRRRGRPVRRLRRRHQGAHRRSAARPRRRLAVAGVTIFASIVAFYASARGLQDGEAVPVIAATSTAANVSCILGGIVVFGDPMPGDTLGIVRPGARLRARRRRRARHAAAGARGGRHAVTRRLVGAVEQHSARPATGRPARGSCARASADRAPPSRGVWSAVSRPRAERWTRRLAVGWSARSRARSTALAACAISAIGSRRGRGALARTSARRSRWPRDAGTSSARRLRQSRPACCRSWRSAPPRGSARGHARDRRRGTPRATRSDAARTRLLAAGAADGRRRRACPRGRTAHVAVGALDARLRPAVERASAEAAAVAAHGGAIARHRAALHGDGDADAREALSSARLARPQRAAATRRRARARVRADGASRPRSSDAGCPADDVAAHRRGRAQLAEAMRLPPRRSAVPARGATPTESRACARSRARARRPLTAAMADAAPRAVAGCRSRGPARRRHRPDEPAAVGRDCSASAPR